MASNEPRENGRAAPLPTDVWRIVQPHLVYPGQHIALSQLCAASRVMYAEDEVWRKLCLELGIGRPITSTQSWREVYMRVVGHKKTCRVTKCYKYGVPSMREVGDLLATRDDLRRHRVSFEPKPVIYKSNQGKEPSIHDTEIDPEGLEDGDGDGDGDGQGEVDLDDDGITLQPNDMVAAMTGMFGMFGGMFEGGGMPPFGAIGGGLFGMSGMGGAGVQGGDEGLEGVAQLFGEGGELENGVDLDPTGTAATTKAGGPASPLSKAADGLDGVPSFGMDDPLSISDADQLEDHGADAFLPMPSSSAAPGDLSLQSAPANGASNTAASPDGTDAGPSTAAATDDPGTHTTQANAPAPVSAPELANAPPPNMPLWPPMLHSQLMPIFVPPAMPHGNHATAAPGAGPTFNLPPVANGTPVPQAPALPGANGSHAGPPVAGPQILPPALNPTLGGGPVLGTLGAGATGLNGAPGPLGAAGAAGGLPLPPPQMPGPGTAGGGNGPQVGMQPIFNFGSMFGHNPPQAAQRPPDEEIYRTPEAFPLSNRNSDRVPNIPRLAPYVATVATVSFDNFLKGFFEDASMCNRGSRHENGPMGAADREACWDEQEADRDVFLCNIKDHVILQNAFVSNPPVTSMLISASRMTLRIANKTGVTIADLLHALPKWLDEPLTPKEKARALAAPAVQSFAQTTQRGPETFTIRRDVVCMPYPEDCKCKYCGSMAKILAGPPDAALKLLIQPL